MKMRFAAAATLFACLLTTSLSALPERPERSDRPRYSREMVRAVEQRYPASTFSVTRDYVINGIAVFEIHVNTRRGDASAIVSEQGEFLYSQAMNWDNRIPSAVRAILDAFGSAPANIDKWDRSTYVVDVEIGRRTYRLDIDSVGRLFDMESGREVREEDFAHYDRVDRRQFEVVSGRLHEAQPDWACREVYRHPDVAGFYVVDVRRDRIERPLHVVMSDQNEIAEWREGISERELPQVVVETVRGVFARAHIVRAQRKYEVYYQVNQAVNRGQHVAMKVTAMGDVTTIHTDADTVQRPRVANDRDPVDR